jgi:hypothetical protein
MVQYITRIDGMQEGRARAALPGARGDIRFSPAPAKGAQIQEYTDWAIKLIRIALRGAVYLSTTRTALIRHSVVPLGGKGWFQHTNPSRLRYVKYTAYLATAVGDPMAHWTFPQSASVQQFLQDVSQFLVDVKRIRFVPCGPVPDLKLWVLRRMWIKEY